MDTVLTFAVIGLCTQVGAAFPTCKPEFYEEPNYVGYPDIIPKPASPIISTGALLVCDLRTCSNISKVVYQKTGVYSDMEWTPVFEIINNDESRPLDTHGEYSLAHRYSTYTFDFLSIRQLVIQDQGLWRCVVYDQRDKPTYSNEVYFNLYSNCHVEISSVKAADINFVDPLMISCDLSMCNVVSKVVYEKQDDKRHNDWIPVYEIWYNTNDVFQHNSYRAGITYTRSGSQYTLSIRNVMLTDIGKWRCVLYDQYNIRWPSKGLDIDVHDIPLGEHSSILPTNPALVTLEKAQFTCIFYGVHTEPTVVWKMNGLKLEGGQASNMQSDNGVWLVRNTINLDFPTHGDHNLSCVINTRELFVQDHKVLVVKDRAQVINPREKSNITVAECSTFTLNCSGSGYRPVITWERNDAVILHIDQRYSIEQNCNNSVCIGSITSVSNYECLDTETYSGIYTCVISLEEPYQSTQMSSRIAVTIAVEEPHLNTFFAGIGMLGLCLLIVSVIAVAIVFVRWRTYRDTDINHLYTKVTKVDDKTSTAQTTISDDNA